MCAVGAGQRAQRMVVGGTGTGARSGKRARPCHGGRMRTAFSIPGLALILVVLWEAFESIVLPRRVSRRFRLTRIFYRSIWKPWSMLARQMQAGKRREALLSYFGPLSLLMLLVVWAAGLVLGFAIV